VRLDAAGPRTWLLAAVAGWAVVAWMLAVAGMGGRIEPLPDDPTMRQPLPNLVPPAPERIGPLAQYAEIGNRPLFTTDRRPKPFSLSGPEEEAPAQTFDYVLTGVIDAPNLQMAILQPSAGGGEPQRLRVGESPDGASAWRLAAVHPRSAVFDGPEGQQILDMRIFDGTGGTPPTVVQPTATPPSAGVAEPPADPVAARPPAVEPAAPSQPVQAETGEDPVSAPAENDAQARMDAIRRRIEARREQLRREAQGQGAPQPPPQPQEDPEGQAPSGSPSTR
jgi:general secretion pathway protein N